MSKKDAKKEPVGQWSGDGHFAGSSPSAPKTAGPLTGEEATGELQSDVEPTGLDSGPTTRGSGNDAVPDSTGRLATALTTDSGPTEDSGSGRTEGTDSVPSGGETGPGPVGGQYREPEPAAPDPQHRGSEQRPNMPAADSSTGQSERGEQEGHGASATDDAGSTASPDKGKSSAPSGGHQEAGGPGQPRPDKKQPREAGSSYGDVARDQADD